MVVSTVTGHRANIRYRMVYHSAKRVQKITHINATENGSTFFLNQENDINEFSTPGSFSYYIPILQMVERSY